MKNKANLIKTLLILLVLLSLFAGEPTHLGWVLLYNSEFTNIIFFIKAGEMSPLMWVLWIMLLVTHLGVICLPFLTSKMYFKTLLYAAPLAFILLYMITLGVIAAFLLIPFAIVWLICLNKATEGKRQKAT
jgi:hypothetical protein